MRTHVSSVKRISLLLALSMGCFAQNREQQLLDRIAALEARLAAVEAKQGIQTATPSVVTATSQAAVPGPTRPGPEAGESFWLKDTTLNLYFDGYYAWNTQRPIGRVNLLRAYDVTSNSFSINQTGMMIERMPNMDAGRRWGYRLDLLYGQATETLQGGAQNEPRPQAYRPLFQAYGSYVLPVGKGLNLDFGKWASSLGAEGNYTKDQINYTRSYFFNFLPFYHTGFRATLPVHDRLGVGYWLVNGSNQTEDFNGFKSQLAQIVVKPASSLSWTLQYYNGQEQRDLVPVLNPGIPSIPSQPGLSVTSIRPIPRGRFHAIDTYAFWKANDKLTLGGELDYVINRVESDGSPQRITGGAAYFKYQITPKLHFGQRYVRLNDVAGLFSGSAQSLNDLTSTIAFRVADGFESRVEYRRDFSNTPFFLTGDVGRLSTHQDTMTLGLLWWFGGKSGGW